MPLYADLEFAGDTIQISQEYYSGPNLIYDCKKGSFICVDDDNVKECEFKREEAKKYYRTYLACASFKRFHDTKECQAYQQKKVNNPEGKRYCIHKDKKTGTTHR